MEIAYLGHITIYVVPGSTIHNRLSFVEYAWYTHGSGPSTVGSKVVLEYVQTVSAVKSYSVVVQCSGTRVPYQVTGTSAVRTIVSTQDRHTGQSY